MKPAVERVGSVLLAAAIGTALALVLVHWVDHSLDELGTAARAALVAAPVGARPTLTVDDLVGIVALLIGALAWLACTLGGFAC